jgi:hypothetical protein
MAVCVPEPTPHKTLRGVGVVGMVFSVLACARVRGRDGTFLPGN